MSLSWSEFLVGSTWLGLDFFNAFSHCAFCLVNSVHLPLESVLTPKNLLMASFCFVFPLILFPSVFIIFVNRWFFCGSISDYLLCISSRFLLCSNHETYVRHLIKKTVHLWQQLNFNCLQKLHLYSPVSISDAIIYFFLYCRFINKLQ